ncbi:DUF6274 family protein [Streptomyces solicathayae]|uniref:DUF6274 family protein n=1 Tax=Streptomyces solicathayae TaxID=3081768 RepID=A0ABZ0LVD1_9ACTN|nr:DUF6274 family protein [Streptomyces sp. HUAS YS2]WOX23457.1 DUF6274 family protein [Streptomyces sp. HUAS YS2]
MAAAATARHETGALLRAHLAAASRYGHVTRTCPVCHRLLRLAMELPEVPKPSEPPAPPPAADGTESGTEDEVEGGAESPADT